MQTKGEYRVGKDFNPSGNVMVDALKSVAADFIDLVEGIDVTHGGQAIDPEFVRLKELAQTEIESAAMWAVKAATKRKGDLRSTAPVSATSAMAVRDDPFIAAVREAIGKYRSDRDIHTTLGATEFVAAELRKVGFLSVSGDDIDAAIVQVERA